MDFFYFKFNQSLGISSVISMAALYFSDFYLFIFFSKSDIAGFGILEIQYSTNTELGIILF